MLHVAVLLDVQLLVQGTDASRSEPTSARHEERICCDALIVTEGGRAKLIDEAGTDSFG